MACGNLAARPAAAVLREEALARLARLVGGRWASMKLGGVGHADGLLQEIHMPAFSLCPAVP
jgi:hypothetical protein